MNSINKEKQLIVRSSDGNVSEAERSEKQNVQSMKEDIIMAKIKESAVELIGGTPQCSSRRYRCNDPDEAGISEPDRFR